MARSYGINVLHAVTGTFDNGQQVNYTTPGAKEIIHFSTIKGPAFRREWCRPFLCYSTRKKLEEVKACWQGRLYYRNEHWINL